MCWRRNKQRRGSVLIEFALVVLVLMFLMAAILDFGRAVHEAQVIQQAADAGARELAHIPLPPGITFEESLQRDDVKARVYDDSLLVVQIPANTDPQTFFATLPLVNRLLAPLMIIDQNGLASYPGAIKDPNDPSGRYKVPLLLEDGGNPVFVHVVEEILPDPNDPNSGPFSLFSTGPNLKGYVALRINFPFQAALLTAYKQSPGNYGDGVLNTPIDAPPLQAGEQPGPYAGADGKGKLLALGRTVRPFRRLLSAQAIYRREVFSQPVNP